MKVSSDCQTDHSDGRKTRVAIRRCFQKNKRAISWLGSLGLGKPEVCGDDAGPPKHSDFRSLTKD